MLPNVPAWDTSPGERLPVLNNDIEADVCVVGLGGSGLSAVLEVLSLGASVVGLDAATVGGGAAGRNGGFLLAGIAAFHHIARERMGHDRARALYELTLAEIERIARETPDAVRRTGSLRLAGSAAEEEDCRLHLTALLADGFPAEWHRTSTERGLVIPSDCAFDPLLRCRLLASRALAAGARLFERAPAVAIEEGVVTGAEATVRCRHVIVAIDGGLECIFPELTGRVRSARLQMLGTSPAPEVHIPRPVYARFGLDYWQQLPDDRVVLGGFRDVGGEEEWTTSADPSEPVQAALDRHLRNVLHVRAAVTHRWAATVGYTADGLPVLHEIRPRVWAVGAYSGTGNVMGAVCGRAAARVALSGGDDVAVLVTA